MSYSSWFNGMFARRPKMTSPTLLRRPSTIKLECLEDRTVPAAAFDPNFHAVASLPPARAVQMEMASGPVQAHANGNAASMVLQKPHITFGGVELGPDAVHVRPYRGAR